MTSFQYVNAIILLKYDWLDEFSNGESYTKTHADQRDNWLQWRHFLIKTGKSYENMKIQSKYSFSWPHSITWRVSQKTKDGVMKAVLRISKSGSVHVALYSDYNQQLNKVQRLPMIEWLQRVKSFLLKASWHGSAIEVKETYVMSNGTMSITPLQKWDDVDQFITLIRSKRPIHMDRRGSAVVMDPYRRLRIKYYDFWTDKPTLVLIFPTTGKVILNGQSFNELYESFGYLNHLLRCDCRTY